MKIFRVPFGADENLEKEEKIVEKIICSMPKKGTIYYFQRGKKKSNSFVINSSLYSLLPLNNIYICVHVSFNIESIEKYSLFILWPCERAKWGLAAAKTMIINL